VYAQASLLNTDLCALSVDHYTLLHMIRELHVIGDMLSLHSYLWTTGVKLNSITARYYSYYLFTLAITTSTSSLAYVHHVRYSTSRCFICAPTYTHYCNHYYHQHQQQ
jgi:hypothetical protein